MADKLVNAMVGQSDEMLDRRLVTNWVVLMVVRLVNLMAAMTVALLVKKLVAYLDALKVELLVA